MLFKSLRYYWRIHAAVVAGAAVATAVLTGALLVGDSVRGSLQDLVLQRLGKIDYALLSEKFINERLSSRLKANAKFKKKFRDAAPAISLIATAVQPESGSRTSNISVYGIDQQMDLMYDNATISGLLKRQPAQIFPSVVINESLQHELGVKVWGTVLLSLQKPGDIHPETVLGERDISNVLRKLRLTVTAIIPDKGVGGLTLQPHQTSPQNAFVDLKALQRSLEVNQKINTLFVSSAGNSTSEELNQILKEVFEFEDTGLRTRSSDDQLIVETSEIIVNPRLEEKIESALLDEKHKKVFTYLANKIRTKDRLVPYSTISAVSDLQNSNIELLDGNQPSALNDDEILLNEWTAKDLSANVDDQITVDYYTIAPGNQLITVSKSFRLAGIVSMKGLAIDSSLAPEYPGIQDKDNLSDWSPPFPVDLKLIRNVDEDYWDQYRAAPKAFISFNEAQRLWSSRFGNLTSIRVAMSSGQDPNKFSTDLKVKLQQSISPADIGTTFHNVKQQGLQASSGSSDFGALFTGFSFFLIISAAMLAGLLFRLGAEQRSPELGTLLAMGYTPRSILRRLLAEGAILAIAGVVLGTFAAAAYAWLMLTGLRTWWQSAVGSSDLQLHINPQTLIIGAVISLLAMLFSLWLSIRRLSKLPVPLLLVGSTTSFENVRPSRWSRIIAFLFLPVGLALVIAALYSEAASAAAMFFGAGACLLISALAFLTIWLRKTEHRALHSTRGAVTSMAARNTSRNPGRSLLSAALVSCACFVIIAVGLNRRNLQLDPNDKHSGTGGYSLQAQSSIPLLFDPSTREGREKLNLTDESLFQSTKIISFRLLPGEDASCLNLYKPEKPRLLGVPQLQIDRGGFTFQEILSKEKQFQQNPWKLLEQDLGKDVIPAIGDYNSVLWILHSGLGKDFTISDPSGRPLRLRFVALLKNSVFQSEILISEKQFTKHFPEQIGYSYLLIDPGKKQPKDLSIKVEEQFADYGVDAKPTVETIEKYHAVENTYLSTFQTLGGLGLLLGTTGLGIILLRNVLERRGELAAMRAFGFERKFLAKMVVAENGFLLCIGILTGTITAALTAAPHLLSDVSNLPWLSLTLTLLLVFVIGMISSIVAVSAILRVPLLPALKAE